MIFRFPDFKFLTFDCYGTLIDWESGILGALRLIFNAHGKEISDAEILDTYAEIESALERERFIPYRRVLRQVVTEFGKRLGFVPTKSEAESLAGSLPDWRPFPDTVPALRLLQRYYKLCIISNIDDDLFAETAPQLEVPFHAVVTAFQAKSYKPSLNNFELTLARIPAVREEVLHVAESLFHDIAPARELGIRNVWVERNPGRRGRASRRADVKPDLEVPNLKTLAEMVESAMGPAATIQGRG